SPRDARDLRVPVRGLGHPGLEQDAVQLLPVALRERDRDRRAGRGARLVVDLDGERDGIKESAARNVREREVRAREAGDTRQAVDEPRLLRRVEIRRALEEYPVAPARVRRVRAREDVKSVGVAVGNGNRATSEDEGAGRGRADRVAVVAQVL